MDSEEGNSTYNTSDTSHNTSKCNGTLSRSFLPHVYTFLIILGVIVLLVILIFTIKKFMSKRHYIIAEPSVKPENGSIQTNTSQTEQDIIPKPVNPPASAPVQPIAIVQSSPDPEDEYFDHPAPVPNSNPYGYVPMTPPAVGSPPSTPPYYVNMFPKLEPVPSTSESVAMDGEDSSSGYVPMTPKFESTASIPKIITCPLPPTPTDQDCLKI